MTLLISNINGKNTMVKERLKSSINLDKASLISILIILAAILFGPIACERLGDNFMFLNSVLSLRLRKNNLY